MYGLDISHFTEENGGLLTPAQLQGCKNFPISRFAISIADQEIATRQIEAITKFNWEYYVELHTYRYYYWPTMEWARERDAEFIDWLRRNLANIQFHWLDIEEKSTNPIEVNVAKVNDLINFWAGKCRTGIYTAYWYWTTFMQNVTDFSYMPLWFAHWNFEEDLNLVTPYGGWTRGTMKQTAGDKWFPPNAPEEERIWCDWNYFEEHLVPEPILIPPPTTNPLDAAISRVQAARIELDGAVDALIAIR